jgi:hypothetical protein
LKEQNYLSEVTRVKFVKEDAVVVLAAGITAASRMATVLTNAPMTAADGTTPRAILWKPGWLFNHAATTQFTTKMSATGRNTSGRPTHL